MMEHGEKGNVLLKSLARTWLAWLTTAAVLLLLFSFLLSRSNSSERVLFYFSSGLAFLTACCASAYAGRKSALAPFICGLLSAFFILVPLLFLGLVLDRGRFSHPALLSLISFTLSGALFGSVFFGAEKKRGRKRRSVLPVRR